ncbi:twin-arginine translocation signal domain-containing protein [Parasutterella excrementihominis]|uniref:Tat pathway signal sequence domain protein n=2 Tax=Parasutterella excrementihominis TaxID=487175 RepID=F3QP18_9BURK|nr:twin-arginine translocation signal domain-containing protein [Parasutterella excrementihominis]EGG50116.1 Tat pathway signal sequence domain protein [Parasutterella excrementihominis YIT 11859]MTT66561.1 twin-arginine translocation signal domain-containing protein [Parasutterella excrementihominis]MTT74282.1 twin-arginine translocation signal domain-containing protein [Parasutterella excrementihominis]MTT94752.1 twin-arginine translocation signal domain-containing protein [Parasutterella exc
MTAKRITRRTFLGTTAVGTASTSFSLNTWAQAINNQKSP